MARVWLFGRPFAAGRVAIAIAALGAAWALDAIAGGYSGLGYDTTLIGARDRLVAEEASNEMFRKEVVELAARHKQVDELERQTPILEGLVRKLRSKGTP